MPFKKAVNAFASSGVAHSWYDKPLTEGGTMLVSLCGLNWDESKLDFDPKQVLSECGVCKRSTMLPRSQE